MRPRRSCVAPERRDGPDAEGKAHSLLEITPHARGGTQASLDQGLQGLQRTPAHAGVERESPTTFQYARNSLTRRWHRVCGWGGAE